MSLADPPTGLAPVAWKRGSFARPADCSALPRMRRAFAWMVFAGGCGESHPGEPRLYWAYSVYVETACPDRLDLLLVVDSTAAMREERENLLVNVRDVVRALVEPSDEDGDGAPDTPAHEDVHLGVVTADPADDGMLRTSGCDGESPPFLQWNASDPVPGLPEEVACLADTRLDAAAAAPFVTAGRALGARSAPGAPNAGFLREDSLLAVFVIASGDDGSAGTPADFAEEILSLRPGRPDRVVFAAVAGVPPDLVALSEDELNSDDLQTDQELERILSDPRMDEKTACDVPGLGLASPSPRIVEAVRAVDRVGNNGLVQSVCQADWTPLARTITRLVSTDHGWGSCFARPLTDEQGAPLESGDHAPCALVETLRDGAPCGPGRIEIGGEDGGTLCHVCQQGDGEVEWPTAPDGYDLAPCVEAGVVWSYTTEDPSCGGAGALAWADGFEEPCGSPMRLRCGGELPR